VWPNATSEAVDALADEFLPSVELVNAVAASNEGERAKRKILPFAASTRK
jgi:hypothetical protein